MKQALLAILASFLGIVIAVVAVTYSGVIDVGADDPPSAVKSWFLRTAMERSVATRASGIEVPSLEDPAMLKVGVAHYRAMCMQCHGAPGVEPDEIARGLHPRPPEFANIEPRFDDAETFWVIKHGVEMTGMSAWGMTHDDEEIWSLVSVVTRLGRMSDEEWNALADSADDTQHAQRTDHVQ